MITNGFIYLATLIFIAAFLINLPVLFRGKTAQKVFHFVPPIVLIYFVLMMLCTFGIWNLEETAPAYSSIKNPLLYAMLFLMLLRCDLKKIIKLGPKMLIGFFSATASLIIGFFIAYAIMHPYLGEGAWKSLGALSGCWMGGSGNMIALQEALHVDENAMGYALVVDSMCGVFYIMFLLWVIGFADRFNHWTKADTTAIDAVGKSLEEEAKANTKPITWQNIAILVGSGLLVSAISSQIGTIISTYLSFFDKATWTVILGSFLGVLLALTPFGKLKGTEELSNVFLYIVVALIASRADLSALENAHVWLLTGLIILIFHIVVMLIMAKLFKLDIFTCAVASLANIGGTASAPVLAGTYSSALVPVGIIMALLGYVIGTGGGFLAAKLMSIFG